ncbi:MAG: L-rhamnose mutarotase [Akkermansiaceae bacterium]|jgi:L-rhamnose mutarotase|nr:L-rhamnose mutarotase [Akkermansiaceae bacterium]MDP4721585.1 L-rhamnose mutarotase [Akkermansiaceae bacterium]MDP4779456.1 L-rhamnose mutarotase [Akkermansiaceae bacterium]MDP4846796.1 L-rhamnose mutarotase [Akkermansiaceae bacterium]MDP4897133.1 L-rhamnose mutarotase [Akkermansiaceae bacterium]
MSPYENLLLVEDFRRVGLISLVREGCEEGVLTLTSKQPFGYTSDCENLRIRNLNLFLRKIGDRNFLFAFFEYAGTDIDSTDVVLCDQPWFAALTPSLEAHPRVSADGHPWMRMELINVVGPTLPAASEGEPVARLGFMSGVRPEKELWYRTLHLTNWPGVIDQIARSHTRYWVTFMIEFGEELFLFTYCEYLGIDKAADDTAMAADPVTQRWWTHTEPCLIPLEPGGGTWTAMHALLDRE